jgi:hypothetical protein
MYLRRRFAANRITIGRDMGWGTTPLVVPGSIGIGTNTPTHRLHVVADGCGRTIRVIRREAPICGLPPKREWTNGWRLSTDRVEGSVCGITAKMYSTSPEIGNVGIGTITPSQKLTVEGSHNAGRDPDSGLLYGGQLAIKGNAPQLDFIDTDHDDWAIMVNGSKMHFIREPWTYTNLVLHPNGNVGIGTDSPGQQLTITGGIGFANQNSQDKKLYSPEDGLLEWMTNDAAGEHGFTVSHQGQTRVYLNTNGNSYLNGGNVGIGTTTPGQKLTVQGVHNASKDPDSGLSAGGQLAIKGNAPQLDFIDIDNNDWGIHVNSNKMYFVRQPWNASDLVLDGNGNVGIGTDAPRQKLDVVGNLKVSGIIEGALHRLVSGDGRYRLDMQTDSNLVVYASDNAPIWSWMTGRISDLSLKKDLSAIQSPLKKLLSLRGVSFAWKDESLGAGREIGVIAQEVEAGLSRSW